MCDERRGEEDWGLTRGDGAVGLVDGVNVPVVPVVDRLGVAGEEGARHHHAGQQLSDLLGVVPDVVPGSGGTACDTCMQGGRG